MTARATRTAHQARHAPELAEQLRLACEDWATPADMFDALGRDPLHMLLRAAAEMAADVRAELGRFMEASP